MSTENRQEFIKAAISFLQNPKLTDSSLKDKLKFLRDKGLSDMEVDEALNLALVNRQQPQSGRWNFLLILGLCFGGYKLYKAYQETRESPTIKQQVTKTEPREGNDSLSLADIMQKISELHKILELQRSNFSADIQSLKTLLLSHERFAAPPMIPAWQLTDPEDEIAASGSTKCSGTSIEPKDQFLGP